MCIYNICLFHKCVFHHKLFLNNFSTTFIYSKNVEMYIEMNNFSCSLDDNNRQPILCF